MSKLRPKDLANYRMQQWIRQGKYCPLCFLFIDYQDAVLDHDHKAGHLRAVLHRSCNHAEGSVKNWAKRSKSPTVEAFLANVLAYWNTDFSMHPRHPTHQSLMEKRVKELEAKLKKGARRVPMERWANELALLKLTIKGDLNCNTP